MLEGETLTRQEMYDILIGITEEKYPQEQIAADYRCVAYRLTNC